MLQSKLRWVLSTLMSRIEGTIEHIAKQSNRLKNKNILQSRDEQSKVELSRVRAYCRA